MAHVERWFTTFGSLGQNVTYTIRILEDGFVGSTTAIELLGKEPLKIRQRGKSEEDFGAVGTEVEFTFIKTPEDGTAYDDLFIAAERQFQIEVERESTLVFRGFMRPETSLNRTSIEEVQLNFRLPII